jgi:hypothetical protein
MRRWLGTAAFACAAAIPVHAASLPPPSTDAFCSVEGNTVRGSTHCEFGGGPGIWSSALADIEPSIPHALAMASTPKNGVLGAGASATIRYGFQVLGPTVGELVPILMDAYLLTESTFESKALARLIVSTTSGTAEAFEACSDGTCEVTTFSETIGLDVLSGSTLDSVTLYAEAQARKSFDNETALAVADPYIYIAPTFPNAHLYSVVVSPGIGNSPHPPVPEPETLYLLGAGLLALTVRMSVKARSPGRGR